MPTAPGGSLSLALQALVRAALAEDVGAGDLTTACTVPPDQEGRAVVVAKEGMVLAGLEVAAEAFRATDGALRLEYPVEEGAEVPAGTEVLRVAGRLAAILTAERTALNFLGRLSGIATLTRRFVAAVDGTGARILDTRKTTPGLRALEKDAVRAGGGFNHRMGLFDFVLVKDNHVAAAGGIAPAVARVRSQVPAATPLEVEVSSLEELEEALGLGVGQILLDNMSLASLREAVRRARARVPTPELEASGNVTLENVRKIAETGVDWISVGALTHSARAADLSLRVLR